MSSPGLINQEDAALFPNLAARGRAAVLAATFEAPGISFQDLAARVGLTRQSISKIASELTEFGLVKLLEDGRHRRVRPTEVLARKREANRVRADAFGEALGRRLAAGGLSPGPLRRGETTLLVRFGMGTQRVLLDLSLDPYGTVWQRAE